MTTPEQRLPDAQQRLRCGGCGNLTRFDVTRRSRVTEFWHVDLGGTVRVEESDVHDEVVERIACRWCGRDDAVTLVDRHDAAALASQDPTESG